MANILLGVTGSVAAIKVPLLYAALKELGHQVKLVATRPALYFFDPAALDPDPTLNPPRRNREVVILDDDEWPGQDEGRRYRREDDVLHIELRRWADLLLIAPLDANTLAKMALGLCDNCLTCVYRGWEPERPIVLAPAMNTLMWQHPATARHLHLLAADAGSPPPLELALEPLLEWINTKCPRLHLVPPETKRLACNDEGVGALAAVETITSIVQSRLVPSRQQTPHSVTVRQP